MSGFMAPRNTAAGTKIWGAWLEAQRRDGRPVYAYFNNDIGGHAPRDAVRLRAAVVRAAFEDTDHALRSRSAGH
jgi:uncharacterized protein YecE (DUF72 family)